MNIFETVKAAVTVRQAAEHYGLKINRSGMICCPFHDDRHPSLKLNEDYFYCFGCGAKGDVIDFVARLLDLSAYEAAQRLAADFVRGGTGKEVPSPCESVETGRAFLHECAVRVSSSFGGLERAICSRSTGGRAG